ncbi:tyrosine-type recombinase/integrase [Rhizobium sp. BC49]|uniref:tyrosine-type recombinase/integrase n=1 Tax=Rhizobium sp. BC49 TaxID=3031127 RepID=UPI0023D8BFFC|nr:tyrosine-type recombinase/integrase [Rhizobium sp. BC49]MDF0659690.1 tyrosine-type recombinase/integrase [Rhizobium sp. BC49]
MGTISARKRQDGSSGYTAQILRKKGGKIVWREAKTFDKEREAKAWIRWREAELDRPGAIEQLSKSDSTLADAIDKYLAAKRTIGRTKEQCLRTIKTFPIAAKDSRAIRSVDIVAFADELLAGDRKPQTVGNYISHLAAIFRDAKAAWDIDLDYAEMQAAQRTLTRLEKTSKSEERTRRPTLGELDMLMQHFADRQIRTPHSAPMCKLIGFGIFSTRRQEEITRVLWTDLDEQHSRILVRDLKHPGQKKGNDVWCELVPEAMAIIKSMPRTHPEIFPYTGDAISAAFTRACQFLEINKEDTPDADRLVFHSLRHEGISRLFEMGRTIPLAASVSGHRTWNSLKRYTDIKEAGDKYAGWKWLDIVCK